jgi:hypothetical protein
LPGTCWPTPSRSDHRVTGGNLRLERLLTQVGRILELNRLEVMTYGVIRRRGVLVIGAA